ncbi:tetratricopeptide repeat protein [Bradyrhizobium sp. USDA 4451]
MSTTTAAEASPADAADMDRVRALINEMINALIERAPRDKITEDKLKEVYWGSFKTEAPAMRPNKTAAYDRLFGFGENGRAYLPRSDARLVSLSKIQLKHIERIYKALLLLGIFKTAPAFGKQPSSWLPFLEYALATIEGRPTNTNASGIPDEAPGPLTAPTAEAPHADREPEKAGPNPQPDTRLGPFPGEVSAQPRLRILGVLATALVFGAAAVGISKLPRSAPRTGTPQMAEASASMPATGEKLVQADGIRGAPIIDPKILIGPNAGSSQANVGVPLTATDPRLEEAARLRAEGNVAEADRLTQMVADDWAKARAVTNKNEAEAHRQLGASAFSLKNYDGSIEEYTKAKAIDPTAADYHAIGSSYHAKFDYGSALTNYSEANK